MIDRETDIMDLRILMLEDIPEDTELIERILRKENISFKGLRVETREGFVDALEEFGPDIILADNKLPLFDGVDALMITRERAPLVPFIFVTGTMGEEWAVDMMKKGATDYVLKTKLFRLGQAVRRALREAGEREDRLKAEASLRQSEVKFRTLADSIKDLFFAMDNDFRYTYWNRASEKLTGISSEEAIGKTLYDLFPDITGTITESQYKEALKTGIKQQCMMKYTYLDTAYFFELNIYPSEKGLSVIGKDITEKADMERCERLALQILEVLNRTANDRNSVFKIIDSIKNEFGIEAIGIRLKEDDDYPYYHTNGFSGDFVESERYLCEYSENGDIVRDRLGTPILACMCGAVLMGHTDPSLPFFTDNGSFWTNSTSELLASTTEEDRQSRTRNRCNGEGYESVALIPLRSGDSIIGLLQMNDFRKNVFSKHIIGFFEGIGSSVGIALERIRMINELTRYSGKLEIMVDERTKELQEAQQQLIRKEKLAVLGELAGGVSHELRNPIGAIKNASYFLKMESDTLTRDMRETIDIIDNEVSNATRIVSTLLDFARPRPPTFVKIDINDFLRKYLSRLSPDAVSIVYEFNDSLPDLKADDVQVTRIFDNIVNNAIQAMPEGGTLTVKTAVEDDHWISIAISDTGIGIPADQLEKLFEPLYTTKAKGIGLGLSIVKTLVERHNGRITVQSEKNRGTMVTVRFPLDDTEQ